MMFFGQLFWPRCQIFEFRCQILDKYAPNKVCIWFWQIFQMSITFYPDLRFHFPRWLLESTDQCRSSCEVADTQIHKYTLEIQNICPKYIFYLIRTSFSKSNARRGEGGWVRGGYGKRPYFPLFFCTLLYPQRFQIAKIGSLWYGFWAVAIQFSSLWYCHVRESWLATSRGEVWSSMSLNIYIH